MGHYLSEMYSDDRTDEEIKRDNERQHSKEQLEAKLCKVFSCKKSELKIIAEILKESWGYYD